MKVKFLSPTAKVPTKSSELAAGYDLYADKSAVLLPRTHTKVTTGLALKLECGFYGRVASRSGLSFNHGIEVGAGVLDADYRGEVKINLHNHSDDEYTVNAGDRVAQLIIENANSPGIEVVADLDQTERGENGFGSTGL